MLCLPWPQTKPCSDSPLTPTPLPASVPAPAGTQGCVTPPAIHEKLQLQGREGPSQGDRASQGHRQDWMEPHASPGSCGNCPGFSTGSPVSWGTSRSPRTGIVVCPAEEEPRISFSSGTIRNSIRSQNEEVAQSFKKCPSKTHTKTLSVENRSFLQKIKAFLGPRPTAAAQVLVQQRTRLQIRVQ